jgi:hypothetical protein
VSDVVGRPTLLIRHNLRMFTQNTASGDAIRLVYLAAEQGGRGLVEHSLQFVMSMAQRRVLILFGL